MGSLERQDSNVRGVRVLDLPHFEDFRGSLSVAEIGVQIPFEIKRFFLVHGVSSGVRGEHAHRTLEQALVCVHGSLHLIVDDGANQQEFRLDRPGFAVYIPPMVWGIQHRHSADAVLLVLASQRYDPADYIRDYSEFLSLCSQQRSG